jgi:hypothetical protein
MTENETTDTRHPAPGTRRFELQPKEVRVPVAFREGGRRYRVVHIFRPPADKDWLEYESRVDARIVEGKGDQGLQAKMETRNMEAGEGLWNACAVAVEGYGSGEQPTLEKIPLPHKMTAIRGLGNVQVSTPDVDEETPYEFDPTSITVELEVRDAVVITGLKHQFRRPTAQELKEFSRLTNSAIWLRGTKEATTLLPSRLKALIDFYDRLIIAIEGYTIDGQPAVLPDAKKHMDAMHKKVAVQGLFSPEENA